VACSTHERVSQGIRISNALFRQAEEYGWTCGLSSTRAVVQDGGLSGRSSTRGARVRGRFGLSAEGRPKEAVGSGSGTGWEGVRAWDQDAM